MILFGFNSNVEMVIDENQPHTYDIPIDESKGGASQIVD